MNILTIFSGRRENLSILTKYLRKAIDLGILHECHFWNFTRNPSDDHYIRSITNLKRSSSADDGKYIIINPKINNNSFDLSIRAPHNVHVKISNYFIDYEIVLGGWCNTKSVIRVNDGDLFITHHTGICNPDNFEKFKFEVVNSILTIYKNNTPIIVQQLQDGFQIKNIQFKTGFQSVADIEYETVRNHGFFYMDTCEKSWKNYYEHYTHKRFENDIILKCDDDIVFLDIPKLPGFIDFVRNNNYDLVLANTINNGVSAHIQQNKYGLIPESLMHCEMPPGGLCGSIWASGEKATILHNYFIDNYKSFTNHNYGNDIIPVPTRFSINFFGYKGSNWHRIADCYSNDEAHLTVTFVETKNFVNVLYPNFYVAHLSFWRQVETNIDSTNLLRRYNDLFEGLNAQNYFELTK
jgi:hypothetical protein